FILAGDLPTQGVIAIASLTAAGKLFFDQLAQWVPGQLVLAAIGVVDGQQAALGIVAVAGGVAVWIGLRGDIALSIAAVLPGRFATPHRADETVAVLVGNRLIFRRDYGGEASGLVV